jgi:hypothetical protein
MKAAERNRATNATRPAHGTNDGVASGCDGCRMHELPAGSHHTPGGFTARDYPASYECNAVKKEKY